MSIYYILHQTIHTFVYLRVYVYSLHYLFQFFYFWDSWICLENAELHYKILIKPVYNSGVIRITKLKTGMTILINL